MITFPITYYHKVTFKLDEGTIYKTVLVKDGATVAEPTAPSKEGYEFKGWQLNESDFDFDTPITQNTILLANFEEEPTPITVFEWDGTSTTDFDIGTENAYSYWAGDIPEGFTVNQLIGSEITTNKIDGDEHFPFVYIATENDIGGSAEDEQIMVYISIPQDEEEPDFYRERNALSIAKGINDMKDGIYLNKVLAEGSTIGQYTALFKLNVN